VDRTSWDLAFNCSESDRVVLNTTAQALVYKTAKVDFTAVDVTDTTGLSDKMDIDAIKSGLAAGVQPTWLENANEWTDHPDGSLFKTAIGEIQPDPALNPVYILNRGKTAEGQKRNWIKIQVYKAGDDYLLKYGSLDSTMPDSARISKDTDFNFVFWSFESGITSVEPGKKEWDIAIGVNTDFELSQGTSGFPVPVEVRDFVLLNRNEVEAAIQIFPGTADIEEEYQAFRFSDSQGLLFSPLVDVIGRDWRFVAEEDSAIGNKVKEDRFYVISTHDGSFYKVLFTGLVNNDGVRGYPQFVFQQL
jgi:hypothetical protein